MSTFATGSFARSNPVAAPLSNNLETSRIPAFDAPERSFGEHFNASSQRGHQVDDAHVWPAPYRFIQ